jgi:hypothetical protein
LVMGWAVGEDYTRLRHIGYGVPAICDYPGCGKEIDRGIDCACGGGVTGVGENCGLFFCGSHMRLRPCPQEERDEECTDDACNESVCERCAAEEPPFDPSPDTREWVEHVLTDESWAQFREEEDVWMRTYRQRAEELGISA